MVRRTKDALGKRGNKARGGSKEKAEPRGDAWLCAAALKVAAEEGWGGVTLGGVATAAKVPVGSVKKRVGTREELIPLIVEQMTREALAGVGRTSGNAHDDLFEMMMARFDVLQKNRAGVLAIADEALRDRGVAVALGRAVLCSMGETVDAAKLELPSQPLLSAGLAGAYGWAFYAWRGDRTVDMSKTMAALDRALKLVGKGMALARRAGAGGL